MDEELKLNPGSILKPDVWKPYRDTTDMGGLARDVEIDGVKSTLSEVKAKLGKVEDDVKALPIGGTPQHVTGVTATESAYKTKTGELLSLVSVNFTPAAGDGYFHKAQVWFVGFNGNSNPQLMAEAYTSPMSFLCQTTGETVTVKVVAVGTTNLAASLDDAPSATLSLDGVVSAPPAPAVSQSLIVTPFGYQFSFDQLAGLVADTVDGYQIYRNSTNDPVTATKYTYVKHNPLNSSPVVVQENVQAGQVRFYWVTAINTSGLESVKTAAQTGVVTKPRILVARKSASITDPAGCIAALQGLGYSVTVNYSADLATCRTYDLVVIEGGGFAADEHNTFIQSLYDDGQRVLVTGNDSGTGLFYIQSAGPLGTTIGQPLKAKAHPTHDGWTTLPADNDLGSHPIAKDYCYKICTFADNTDAVFELQSATGGKVIHTCPRIEALCSTTDGKQFVRNIVEYLAGRWIGLGIVAIGNLDNMKDGVTFRRPRYVGSDGTFTVSTMLNGQGSIVPGQPVTISFSYTSSSITLTWTSQSMLRADGSTLTLNAGTLTYSSLSQGTTYYIYTYIRVSDGTLQCTNPTPPQTSPSPVYATQTAFDGRIPVALFKVTTALSGNPGGGGTGGGGDTCPEWDEGVDIHGTGRQIAGEVGIGSHILGHSFKTGQDVYRKVIAVSSDPCAAWRIVNGHRVSPTEPVWWGGQWMPAFKVPGAKFDTYNGYKVNITVESDDYDESNFYLIDGEERLLIHNSVARQIDVC